MYNNHYFVEKLGFCLSGIGMLEWESVESIYVQT